MRTLLRALVLALFLRRAQGVCTPDAALIVADLVFTRRTIVTNEAKGARCAQAADLDGDGLLDIVSASSTDNTVAWYKNLGGDAWSGKNDITYSSNGARIVDTGDVDGDGDVDVVVASYYDDAVRWIENDGTGVFTETHLITTSAVNAQGVELADLDGDGDLDVISASSGDNTVAVYLNIGVDGSFCEIKRIVDDNAFGVRTVIAVDLDGDGDNDLVSASKDDNTVAWYPNDGAASFPEKVVISNTSFGAYSLVARDIDADGDMDLFVASNGDDTVALWRNEGAGVFTKTIIYAEADFVLSVTAFDFDRDGDMDVASASYFDSIIRWYENLDGNGTTWQNHTLYVGAQGHYVSTGDLDGDGDEDLIAVTKSENRVQVFFAATSCDEGTGADAGSAACCRLGQSFNGSACVACSPGTYGIIGTDGLAECTACPATCTIPGLVVTPATCSGVTGCADASASAAACDCPDNEFKSNITDTCTACPSGQTKPPSPSRPLVSFAAETMWQGFLNTCEVDSSQAKVDPVPIIAGCGGGLLMLVLVGFCFLRRRLRRLAVRFGLSPYRLAKLVGWRYLLPAVFQRWWLRRHHLDAHTQLRKAAKEAERPDEQFRAELRGDAELRALFDRVASPATGLVGMQDWLRFCSTDQAEADLEKARTQFLLAVREAHLTAMAAESSGKSHTSMATPPAPRRVIEAARAAAGMARDGVGKASGLSKRRSGSTLPAVSGGVCGPGGEDEGATLNHEQFALLLLRSENRAACPRLLGEEHDASRPLSHYWIAASHNTYITGHQLTSEADAGMYSRLLLCGCRSLEVDIVDGMDGPVVTHHYTLVTRIQLKKVLHAIADAAFITSDLPVHLSLDVRASPKQQARAAELIVEVLGSALVLPEERLADGAPLAAACPHLLRRRILCKGKTVAGRELAARICGDCRRSEDRFTVSSAQQSRRTVSTSTTTLRESDNEDGWALPHASEERDSRTSFPSGILGESSADPTQSFRPSTLSSGSGRFGSEMSTAAALGRIVIRTHAMALQRVEAAHALAREAFFLERPREGRDSGELLTVTSASELHFSHAAEAKLSDALGVIMPPPGRKQSTSHRSRSSISPGRLFGRKAPRSTTSGSLDLPSSDGSQRLARAKRLSEEEWRVAMQERTVRRIVRVFPKGTRAKSDNFDPMPCWAAGAQMAALNLQTNDLPTQLHHALFELNGGRGYVLKPAEMLGEPGGGVAPNWPPPRVVLHVATLRPISLFGLPPRGIDRPDVFGGGGSLHTHVPSLSVAVGKRRMRAPRGEDELPSLAVELHAIGGFSCVSLTLPPATARTRQLVSAKGGGGGEAVRYGGEVHCVAAERQQTVLRVAVLDEEEEAAYETCVLGVLREGYRVLHMRSTRGTRIRNCFLLCHISFTTQVNAWVGESEMMAYVRSKEKEMEEKVDEAAAEVAKLKTGKVVSHLKAMVGSHGAFESATRGGEQLEQLAAANKETSGWTEESVEQSV